MYSPVDPLRIPAHPADAQRAGFPLVASLAPLAAAAAMWAITGSLFALVFAGLSPVMAVASVLDSRRTSRRTRRRDSARYGEAIGALQHDIDERLELLRQAAWLRTPASGSILRAPDEALRWAPQAPTEVSLGVGAVASGLVLEGDDGSTEAGRLRLAASTLRDAPVTADARGGIGIVGSPAAALALGRALLVQLSFTLSPERWRVVVASGSGAAGGTGWSWSLTLPHAGGRTAEHEIVVSEGAARSDSARSEAAQSGVAQPGGQRIILAVAPSIETLPPGCATIVRMRSPEQAELVRSAAGQRSLVFSPDLASVVEAARHATELCRSADAAGISQLRDVVPSSVQLRDIGVTADQPHPSSARGRGLDCAVGLSADGPLCIDLVRQGPHAVVGGTTGSGKSELLVTWIVAMAARYPPDEVTFLLVDFKGGAALSALTTLPHCVGLVTDLDEHEATRALESLTAELRYREQILADAGAREIGDARIVPSVPRLVIVVDEFATMLGAFPDLHALFVDIAARGRSLGVHLILCTQRPAGVVRDALLANCSLRLSLRVNNRADSLAVIGTDAAASLAPTLPGRVLIKCGVGDPRLCQIATTSVDDIQQIIGRAHDASAGEPRGDRARRPWLPPLPPMVTREVLAAVAAGGPAAEAGADELQIGLFDEPAHQRYRVAGYAPTRHGHLLVVGAAHSGKSAALAMMAEQARKTAHPVGLVELVDADIENTWDALDRAHRRCLDPDATTPGLLLLLDDFDSVYARWESDYRLAALDLLTIVLRDGAAAGITLVIAVQRAVGGLQILSTLCGSALLLRMQNLDEHRAAGGVPARFDTTLPAGGGSWRGTRIQLLAALDPTGGRARPQPLPGLSAQSTLVLISGSPARCVERLREIRGEVATVVELTPPLGGARGQLDVTALIGPTAFVGDPDAWQIEWAALQLLRQRSPLIFDRCTLADYRLISRRREVPPPLAPGRNRVWVLEPDGHVHRGSVESGR